MTDRFPALHAAYNGTSPDIEGHLAFAGEGAVVLGRAKLGDGAWLGPWAVIRADGHDVVVGAGFHLGEHGTVHIAHDIYPAHIGTHVTAGAGAVIHACTVADDCVVDRGAVILDGSRIGAGAVIAAGSVVFPRTELDGGWLYAGCPAKPVGPVSASELADHHDRVRRDRATALPGLASSPNQPDCFVAPTARVRGDVSTGNGVGIWYGCRLDAGAHRIVIGEGTNVQDNSFLTCEEASIEIGPDVTIGHNVTLSDCTIGANCLIGIGSVIAKGTVVEDDVLLAAGAQTEPGQTLTAGNVWAGRPARATRPMNPKFRGMLSEILPQYREYAERFRVTPHDPLAPVSDD